MGHPRWDRLRRGQCPHARTDCRRGGDGQVGRWRARVPRGRRGGDGQACRGRARVLRGRGGGDGQAGSGTSRPCIPLSWRGGDRQAGGGRACPRVPRGGRGGDGQAGRGRACPCILRGGRGSDGQAGRGRARRQAGRGGARPRVPRGRGGGRRDRRCCCGDTGHGRGDGHGETGRGSARRRRWPAERGEQVLPRATQGIRVAAVLLLGRGPARPQSGKVVVAIKRPLGDLHLRRHGGAGGLAARSVLGRRVRPLCVGWARVQEALHREIEEHEAHDRQARALPANAFHLVGNHLLPLVAPGALPHKVVHRHGAERAVTLPDVCPGRGGQCIGRLAADLAGGAAAHDRRLARRARVQRGVGDPHWAQRAGEARRT
mmetsp:Transcript_104609/g.322610  ORF Transcript_104609/g.322610 Transcript_104609/m.322610 type:complete len:374 (+) Transcript_104609:627-1748(+)